VEIGEVCDLRAPRVDHDHAAAGRLLDLVHRVPRPLEAVCHPGIAPEHHEEIGVLDVLRRMAELIAVEPPVHPEVAGLLLREGVEVFGRAEHVAERQEVRAAEVVALSAAAVERERLAAVLGPDRVQTGRDLGERGVPQDRLVRSVGTAPKRRRQAIGVVAVPLETLRLLTEIPLRARVRAVAAHACDLAPLGRDLEAAVHVTEDAEGRTPYVGRLLFVHHYTSVPW